MKLQPLVGGTPPGLPDCPAADRVRPDRGPSPAKNVKDVVVIGAVDHDILDFSVGYPLSSYRSSPVQRISPALPLTSASKRLLHELRLGSWGYDCNSNPTYLRPPTPTTGPRDRRHPTGSSERRPSIHRTRLVAPLGAEGDQSRSPGCGRAGTAQRGRRASRPQCEARRNASPHRRSLEGLRSDTCQSPAGGRVEEQANPARNRTFSQNTPTQNGTPWHRLVGVAISFVEE